MLSKYGVFTLGTIAAALTIGSVTGQAAGVVGPYFTSITFSLDVCGNGGVGGCMPDSSNPTLSDVTILDQAPNEGIAVEYSGPVDGEVSNYKAGGLYPLSWVPAAEFAMAWLNYVPSDGTTPADHLVLFVKHGSIAPGQSWDTLFPDFSETDIIQDLKALEAGDPAASGNPILYNFEYQDLSSSMLFAPDGGAFDAVAFSSSNPIGTGISSTQPSIVPEPSQWVTLLLGMGCLAFRQRRRAS